MFGFENDAFEVGDLFGLVEEIWELDVVERIYSLLMM